MTKEKSLGSDIMYICDECGEVLDTMTEDDDEARGIMRAEHWKQQILGDQQAHFCPTCQEQGQ